MTQVERKPVQPEKSTRLPEREPAFGSMFWVWQALNVPRANVEQAALLQ